LVNGKISSTSKNQWNFANFWRRSYCQEEAIDAPFSKTVTATRYRAGRKAQGGVETHPTPMPTPVNSRPDEIQPEERLVELARIFAKAYDRFRLDGPSDSTPPSHPDDDSSLESNSEEAGQ